MSSVAPLTDRLRLLAVFAAPVADEYGNRPAGVALDMWGEWEALQAALTDRDPVSSASTPWDVVRLSPPTPEKLGDALAGATHRVVHLAGHGCPLGIFLEDDLGRERLVTTAELIRQLRGRGVELVVLNACDTAAVAGELVAAGVAKAVVAMREPIYDREAALLAGRLYARLGAGDTLATALNAARESLKERIRSAHPVLGLGNKDPEVRAANWIVVGDGGLRLRGGQEVGGEARFVRLATPHNDPLPLSKLSGFVGRHAELYRLATWLASPGGRLFVIHGVGGVGKTSLVLNAALRASHRFDAMAWASAKDNPALGALAALGAVAAATGLAIAAPEAAEPISALTRRLNAHRILLVLDNFESVSVDHAKELAQAFTGLEPGCGSRVLVTLRPRDRSPLTDRVPEGERLRIEVLDPPSALARAFAEILRQKAPIPPENEKPVDAELSGAAAVAGLEFLSERWLAACGQLARGSFGHPSILDFATASVGREGWASAFTRLRLLKGKELEEALEEMIGAMIDRLAKTDPGALTVLHATRIFPAGVPAEMLAYVAIGSAFSSEEEQIGWEDGPRRAALDSNLLTRTGDRFDLDPPVRRFFESRSNLNPANERLLRLRQGKAFAELIETLDERWRKGGFSLSAVPEWQNLVTGWAWLAEASAEDDDAARLLVAQSWPWRNLLLHSYDAKRRPLFEAAVSAAERLGDRFDRAHAQLALGDLERVENRLPEARANFLSALELFRLVGDRLGEANTQRALGDLEFFEARRPEARAHFLAALGLFRLLGERLGEANTQRALGDLEHLETRLPEARAHFLAALDLFRLVGSRLGEANTQRALGDLEHFEARLPEARAHFLAALDLYQLIGLQHGEANTRGSLALLALAEGNDELARESFKEALALFPQSGDLYSAAVLTGNFGLVFLRLGRQPEGLPYLQAAATDLEALGYKGAATYFRAAEEAISAPDQRP